MQSRPSTAALLCARQNQNGTRLSKKHHSLAGAKLGCDVDDDDDDDGDDDE